MFAGACPSSSTSRVPTPAFSAAARAVAARGPVVTRNRAAESWICAAISSADQSGLRPLTTPPAAIAPWQATSHSGELGERIATTSPLTSPSAAKPAAARSIRWAKSP